MIIRVDMSNSPRNSFHRHRLSLTILRFNSSDCMAHQRQQQLMLPWQQIPDGEVMGSWDVGVDIQTKTPLSLAHSQLFPQCTHVNAEIFQSHTHFLSEVIFLGKCWRFYVIKCFTSAYLLFKYTRVWHVDSLGST